MLTQEWENYQKGGQYEKNMETANKYFNVFNNGIRKQLKQNRKLFMGMMWRMIQTQVIVMNLLIVV